MIEVRPFARSDREQVTRLANGHIGAVLPGVAIPSAALLSQLERDPAEYVVDPWVQDRRAFVAIENERVVAAAHLKRYAADPRVSEGYRGAGEIAWLVCWPNHVQAGGALLDAAVAQFQEWQVRIQYADGSLPSIGTSGGVPAAWPHIAELYRSVGFSSDGGHVELQLLGSPSALAEPGPAPLPGLTMRRTVGTLATAFNAVLDGEVVAIYEVDDDHAGGGSRALLADWADECNNWVREDLRGQGIGSWLLRHAGKWLRAGGKRHLLAYVIEGADSARALRYYARHGFEPINRSVRGWSRMPSAAKGPGDPERVPVGP